MDKFNFEQSIKRLELIVQALEKGEAPLEQSLALFEEGASLVKKCNEALDSAEQKLTVLVKREDGPQEVLFEV